MDLGRQLERSNDIATKVAIVDGKRARIAQEAFTAQLKDACERSGLAAMMAMLAKSLPFLAGADAAGILLGARVPVILTSRADAVTTRLASCAIASLVASVRREAAGKAVA